MASIFSALQARLWDISELPCSPSSETLTGCLHLCMDCCPLSNFSSLIWSLTGPVLVLSYRRLLKSPLETCFLCDTYYTVFVSSSVIFALGPCYCQKCIMLIIVSQKQFMIIHTVYTSFSSVVQSLSRVRLFPPYELQHARPPCPSPTPGVHSNSCPLSQ